MHLKMHKTTCPYMSLSTINKYFFITIYCSIELYFLSGINVDVQ